MLVFCLIAILFGLFVIIKPNVIWAFTEKWKGNAEEPSNIYVMLARLTGICICILAILILII